MNELWLQLREAAHKSWNSSRLYGLTFLKWSAVSLLIGGICGVTGAVFHHAIHFADGLRAAMPWLLLLLPLAGLGITAIYQLAKTEGLGTNDILKAINEDQRLPFLLMPSVFLGTILTHLCGGSAGREGAALQIGGTIGQGAGRAFHMNREDLRVTTLCGMAACFSALFGTPLAATVFTLMCVNVGTLYHGALLPCLFSALTAYGVAFSLHVEPTHFTVTAPPPELSLFIRTAILAVPFALLAVLFCKTAHSMEHFMHRRIPNPWLRVVAGGCAVIVLTWIVGSTDYNGAGMQMVAAAIEQGEAQPAACLWKILFTSITLAAGFKGGEVVPSFFVGASFGCVAAPLVGLPSGFGAALGLISVFCGVTNCPFASMLLSVELFGSDGILYFALSCAVSYLLSGYSGLYSGQKILYSKGTARYLGVHTEGHRAGEAVDEGTELEGLRGA